MNAERLIWFGRYEGWLRHLARGVRDMDGECLAKAARLFDLMLPDGATVVPMPSHNGRADAMLNVAIATGRRVVDCLCCDPHESNYSQKQDGCMPREISMRVKGAKPTGDVFVIDSVIASGVTAAAALAALPNAHVCRWLVDRSTIGKPSFYKEIL